MYLIKPKYSIILTTQGQSAWHGDAVPSCWCAGKRSDACVQLSTTRHAYIKLLWWDRDHLVLKKRIDISPQGGPPDVIQILLIRSSIQCTDDTIDGRYSVVIRTVPTIFSHATIVLLASQTETRRIDFKVTMLWVEVWLLCSLLAASW